MKNFVLFLGVVFLFVIIVPNVKAEDLMVEQLQQEQAGGFSILNESYLDQFGQSFHATSTVALSTVKMKFGRQSTDTVGSIFMDVYSPTSTLLYTSSGSVDISSIQQSGNYWTTFTEVAWSFGNANLVSGQKYFLRLRGESIQNLGTNKILTGGWKESTNPYNDGEMRSGVGSSAYLDDMWFKVYWTSSVPVVPVITIPQQNQSIKQYFWPLGTCDYQSDWTNLVVRLKDWVNVVMDAKSTKCLSDGTWYMLWGYPDGQNSSFLVPSSGQYRLNVKQCEDADLGNCTAWSTDRIVQVGPDAPVISIPIDEQVIWESYYDLSGSCEYLEGWNNIYIESATGTTLLSYTNAWCQSNGMWSTASGTSLQIWPGGQDIWAHQIASSYYVSATSSVIQVWGNVQSPPGSDVPFTIPWGTYATTTPWVTATSATSTLTNVPYEFQWLGGFVKDVLYWLFVPDADFLRYAWTWTSGQFLTMPIWTIPNEAYHNIKSGLVLDSDLPAREASVMGMSVNLNSLVPELAEQLSVPLDAFNGWFRLILAISVVAHISSKIRALFSDERFAEAPL